MVKLHAVEAPDTNGVVHTANRRVGVTGSDTSDLSAVYALPQEKRLLTALPFLDGHHRTVDAATDQIDLGPVN